LGARPDVVGVSLPPVKKVFDEAANRVQIGRQMPESSGTPKAIAIIVFMLAVLAGLLLWANYMRPHP